jgi:hypothetical protein
MGTLLQEFGHDIVLLHFIDKVLKREGGVLFYIVSPATGPRIDIYFRNEEKNEFTSAYNTGMPDYIPGFAFRTRIEREVLERLEEGAHYRRMNWYRMLSKYLQKDLKKFVECVVSKAKIKVVSLPDLIAISDSGKQIYWVEIKFEGFGRGAQNQVRTQCEAAKQNNMPFYLVLPKRPLYGRELTVSWIKKHLPGDMIVYRFLTDTLVITPTGHQIQFEKVK